MDEIESLRRRAEQAQQRIGRPGARSGQMSDRLAELVEAVDAEIAEQASIIDQHKVDIARLNAELEEAKVQAQQVNQENEQVRAILKSLLLAIEGEGATGLGETMVQLETKVSALVDDDGMDAAPADEPAEIVADPGDETVAEHDTAVAGDAEDTVELGEAEAAENEEPVEDEVALALEAEPEQDALTEPEVALEEPAEIAEEASNLPDEAADVADVDDLAAVEPGVETELAVDQLVAGDAVADTSDTVLEDEAVAPSPEEEALSEVVDVNDTVGRYLEEDGEKETPDVAAPVSAIGDIVERLKSENQLSEPADPESLAS